MEVLMNMWIDHISVNHVPAIAKFPSKDYPTILGESGSAPHLLQREMGIACLILIALLICSSIAFAQIKSRQLSDFSEGLVAMNEPTGVPKGKEDWLKYWGKCGYRNTKGEWVIPAQFDWAGPFNRDGYALVIVGSRVHDEEVRLKWKKVYEGKRRAGGRVLLFDGGRLAVIDKTGRVLIELPRLAGKLGVKFQWIDYYGHTSASNVLSYMNSEWESTVDPDLYFNEGRAVVQLPQGCNYLQKSGDSLAFAFAQPFSDCGSYFQGWAAAADNSKKWGFIGIDGQWRIPATFQQVSTFSDGLAMAKTGDLWGFIGTDGQWRIPATFQQVSTFSDGLAMANTGDLWGFIGIDGKWRIRATFQQVSTFSDGLAMAKTGDLWGFIGTDGQWRIPATYRQVSRFSDGLAIVQMGEFWGAIDKSGAIVIPIKYRGDFSFSEGLAVVEDDKNVLFIDNRGQTVAVLDILWVWSDAGQFHEGLVLMSTRTYGTDSVAESTYLDRKGNTVFKIKGKCKDFSKNVAECEDTYQPENSIRFDKMGRIISRRGDSANLEKSLAASPGPAKENQSALASSTPVIQDKAEYTAYMSALKSPDLLQRAGALEAFVRQYPNSVVKFGALEGAMFAYAQANSQAKAAELAQIILMSDPNHVRALAVTTFVKRFASSQNDSKAAAEVGSYAERGLKALAGWAKPNGMSDAEFTAARNQAEAILNGGAGYAAFRRNDYVSTRDYYLKALTADSSNILDTFELGSAELQMQPLDINGFWHTARAIQAARSQKQTDSDLIVFYEAMGKAKYREYHGSTDGWDALVAQATQLTPPPGFTVQRGSAPNTQNAGNKPAPEDAKTLAALAEIDGAILRKKGDLDGAIRAYREAIQLNPLSAHFHEVLASILYDKRDFDAAIKESGEAIRLDPNVASAYYFRGASYQQKSDYYTALVDYNRALHFDPKYTNALGGRADVYYFTRQYRVAIEDYTAFIAAMPKSSVAYSRRGTCHYGLGEYRQTVMDYEKAIAMDPNLLEAVNGLAWVLATAPADGIRNGLMAVGYAERALSLAGKIDTFLHMDTLAAAYAEAGRFTDAVSMQTKAISLIPQNYDPTESAAFTTRLESYRNHKPWREQPKR
jgi:tetratricopeptide (TPR) repeat protein